MTAGWGFTQPLGSPTLLLALVIAALVQVKALVCSEAGL
jgi:hypothetical protein